VFEQEHKLCITGIGTHIFQMHYLQQSKLLLLYGSFITVANLIMQQLGHVKGKDFNLLLSSTP
jgi:hypothetical protein